MAIQKLMEGHDFSQVFYAKMKTFISIFLCCKSSGNDTMPYFSKQSQLLKHTLFILSTIVVKSKIVKNQLNAEWKCIMTHFNKESIKCIWSVSQLNVFEIYLLECKLRTLLSIIGLCSDEFRER